MGKRNFIVVPWGNSRLAVAASVLPNHEVAGDIWGFHTVRGRGRRYINPGDVCFRPRVVGVVDVWNEFRPGDGTLPSPSAAGLRLFPERQLSRRAGSISPAVHKSADGGGVSTPCGAVLTVGLSISVPWLLELYMYGTGVGFPRLAGRY